MRWSDDATWLADIVWDDTDVLGVIVTTEENIYPSKKQVSVAGMITSELVSQSLIIGEVGSDTDVADLTIGRIYIDKIVIVNSTANTGYISCGSTSGGIDIFESKAVVPSDANIISVGKYFSSLSLISFNDNGGSDDWNSTISDIYILYWKL